MNPYSCHYFIEKFKGIPENRWAVAELASLDDTAHCALGHCGGYETEESLALARLFFSHLKFKIESPDLLIELSSRPHILVYMANDGDDTQGITFRGTTPKSRVLIILKAIQRKQSQESAVREAKEIISNPQMKSRAKTKATSQSSGRPDRSNF